MATETVLNIRDRLIRELAERGVALPKDAWEDLEEALDDAYTCGVDDGEALAEMHGES